MSTEQNKDIWFFVDAYFQQKPMYKDFFIETWIQCMKDDNWKAVPREVRLGLIELVFEYYTTTFTFVYNVFIVGLMANKPQEERDLYKEDIDKASKALKVLPLGLERTLLGY